MLNDFSIQFGLQIDIFRSVPFTLSMALNLIFETCWLGPGIRVKAKRVVEAETRQTVRVRMNPDGGGGQPQKPASWQTPSFLVTASAKVGLNNVEAN